MANLLKSKKMAQTIERIINNNTNKSLADYSAQPYLKLFIDNYSQYMEYEFKNESILGHTLTDDLGTSTTINSNINDPTRMAFTQAHELGHLFLHQNELKLGKAFFHQMGDYIKDQDYAEKEANCFAANLLMPDDVLYAVMYEGKSRKNIKSTQFISYEAFGYRLYDFLLNKLLLPKDYAQKLKKEFMNSLPGHDKESILSKSWKRLIVFDYNDYIDYDKKISDADVTKTNINIINNYYSISKSDFSL